VTLQQIKKELAGILKAVKPEQTSGTIIIYDPEKGIPEELLGLDDGIVRIFIPNVYRND